MSIITRLRFAFANANFKAAQLPYVPTWVKASWLLPSFDRLTRDGYASNAAVYACISTLAFAFPEAPLQVLDMEEEPVPQHPLQKLFRRPNTLMSEAEFATFVVTYLAIGGNCYLHKVRNGAGGVVELWPYHAGHMMPVPGGDNWISHYEYNLGDGNIQRVDSEDIIHLKWPLPDLEQPWLAMPPLRAVAREVDTDSEATRYMYALLMNDAMPRTAIQMPAGSQLNEVQFERLRQQWAQRHGGGNRGSVAFLEGGATIERLSLNLQELAFDAIRRVPETRIAAAFRVPAIIAGLNAGLERSTYSNFEEARKQFTENTLVPLWRLVSDEMEQDLGAEFGGNVIVRHDTSRVAALQDNENEKYTRVALVWEKGVVTRNEARKMLGLQETPDSDIFIEALGVGDMPLVTVEGAPASDGETPVNIEAAAGLNGAQITAALAILAGVSAGTTTPTVAVELLIALGISPEKASVMVGSTPANVAPAQLPAPEKGLKAAPKLDTIEQQVERVAAELLKSHFKQAAEAVRA
jgi:HK97 family phage portal protein